MMSLDGPQKKISNPVTLTSTTPPLEVELCSLMSVVSRAFLWLGVLLRALGVARVFEEGPIRFWYFFSCALQQWPCNGMSNGLELYFSFSL